MTPLFYCVVHSLQGTAIQLIAAGAIVNYCIPSLDASSDDYYKGACFEGFTALHAAALGGRAQIAESLLKGGSQCECSR